jgi:hypothetical protein
MQQQDKIYFNASISKRPNETISGIHQLSKDEKSIGQILHCLNV